ncbi:hypothetical protein E2562_039068 [Oryza meyeriana var. granulata]|uniref:F-box/LRR-repeat protein 15/At3g58940/PEG3-like LRR domain-containing protein n=1 Tax=Oryza meyeriana var. granulata TaxID=110450 RepID=A0A6G1BQF9_9ORYZ|nr:hypothetical protein E2562_039068 [Oryza meyeriana var. granulata]
MDRESIIASVVATFQYPLATLTQATPPAVLAPPVNPPHAAWRGLPDDGVANILVCLPVLDLFRICYLFSPGWRDIWRAQPLFLHDRQFTTPPIAADRVADAITNVLELHVGDGVQVVAGGRGGDGDGGEVFEVLGPDGEEDPGDIINAGAGGLNNQVEDDDDDVGADLDDEAEGGGVDDDGGPAGAAVGIDGAPAGAAGDFGGEGVAAVGPGAPGGVGADEGVISDDDNIYVNDGAQNGEIGRVYSFRLETTGWRPEHLERWCAALQRGHAREIVLANLSFPGHVAALIYLPAGIRNCTSLQVLHVFFFTVEAIHIDPLARLRQLGLYGCVCRPGMIERALHPQSEIRVLKIHYGVLGNVAIAATRLRHLAMSQTQVGTVTVDDAIQFRELVMYHRMRPSKLTINNAPRLQTIVPLDLFHTVFEIQGIVIKAGMVEPPPQMPSVERLSLRVNHTQMLEKVPQEIEQILRCFPRLNTLEILRDDDVPKEEGFLKWSDRHIYEDDNLFDGLNSINERLESIHLDTFRGGKYEVALIKAILDKVQVLKLLRIQQSPAGSVPENVLNEIDVVLLDFSLITSNEAVRQNPVGFFVAKERWSYVRLGLPLLQ